MVMSRRGFTLLEQLLVLAIAMVVLATGMAGFRRSHHSAQSRTLAEAVAQLLRSARQRAIAQQHPVAVGLNCGGGQQGHCQSFYLLEGQQHPRITRTLNLAGELPEAILFQGAWGSPLSLSRPRCGDRSDSFDVNSWSSRGDLLLTFLPNGQLVTNDGVWCQGQELRLLTSLGIETTPASLQSTLRPVFAPTRVCQPYTLHLSTSGAIWVSPGADGLLESLRPLACAPPASPLRPESSSNQTPRILRVQMLPDPNLLSAQGVDLRISADEYATLVLEADDPDGDRLEVRWSSDEGAFSHSRWMPMHWDDQRQRWTATWAWQPPTPFPTGQVFQLRGQVRDLRGGLAQTSAEVTQTVGRGSDTRALFQRGLELFTVPLHGSGIRKLAVRGSMATWTADGSRILYYRDNTLIPTLCHRDGTGPVVVHNHYGGYPCYALSSPQGERILNTTFGTPPRMWVSAADGGTRQELNLSNLPVPAVCNLPDWSPDGQHLVFAWASPADQQQSYRLARYDFSTDSAALIAQAPGENYYWPVWSPDGARIACTHRPASSPPRVLSMLPDGSDVRILATMSATTPADAYMLSWSHDGSKLAYCDDAEVWVVAASGGTPVNISNHAANDRSPSWTSDGHLVFLSDRQGPSRLYLCDSDGGNLYPLTDDTAADVVHPSKGSQDHW